MSYFPLPMAYAENDAAVGGQPPIQVQRVGGWKLLVGAMLAAVGLGFAGYVYVGPYQKVGSALRARNVELGQERSAGEDLQAEREKLKTELAKREQIDQEKAATDAKRQQAFDAFAGELKTALGAFGASVSAGGGRGEVTFPMSALFEQPTSTVISPQGEAALKILAAAVKKNSFRTRVMAKLITAPPPKDLSQFKNIGEFVMLRAVRVALGLAASGVAPDRVAAAGEAPLPGAQKGRPAVPDRLEIEIEPE